MIPEEKRFLAGETCRSGALIIQEYSTEDFLTAISRELSQKSYKIGESQTGKVVFNSLKIK